jgi:putative salt-induced outer membrane protein YdiY
MKQFLLSGLVLSLVSAQAFSEEVSPWQATAELGGTMTTGNTETSTLKAKLDIKHELAEWKNAYYADVLYSEDAEEKTASRWKIGAKGGYVIDDTSNIFILGEHEQDEFSDYDSVSSIAAGYSKRLFKNEQSMLDLDVGPGYKFFDLQDGGSEKTGILHMGLAYENALSETSKFTQVLVTDVAFKDDASTLSRSETAITANIMGELAMKLGLTIRHDNNAGADKKSIDTETTITLLYTF